MISALGEAGLIHSGLAWLCSTPTCREDWGVGVNVAEPTGVWGPAQVGSPGSQGPFFTGLSY